MTLQSKSTFALLHLYQSSLSVRPADTSPSSAEGSRSTIVTYQERPELNFGADDMKVILGNFLITSDRLTIAKTPISAFRTSKTSSAKLDKASRTSRDVAVKEFARKGTESAKRYPLNRAKIAYALKAWGCLEHPNVLKLLGCTLHLNIHCEILRLISPYMIHGNIRQYLAQASVEIPQRIKFVRDVTAGLAYLHSQSPPICHGNLNPIKILIDSDLKAVLSGFEPAELYDDPWTSFHDLKFMSPEFLLGEDLTCNMPSDVWSWGCCVFEILTDEQPFIQREKDGVIIYSIITRRAPGRPELLLDLVPDPPKPKYASTLRQLRDYLPLCWEYEPRKRPPISLLHRQVSMFSLTEDSGDSVVATLEELAHLLIPPDRLRIVDGSELGSGNYGEVVLGTLDEASPAAKNVAVKRLKARGVREDRIRLAKRLARELNVWVKIRHPNVVELIGYYLDDKFESPLLISALMSNGNVLKYIDDFKPVMEQRIGLVKGITAGLACLHDFDPAICHADLKPANVLIDLHMNAVLCDFGLASFVGGSPTSPGLATTSTRKGTPRYMSPELLFLDNCAHSLESDVWAWACTVFQVLTGSVPYAEARGEGQLFMAIHQRRPPGEVALVLSSNVERVDEESALALQFLHSVIPRCWDFKLQHRPKMCDLLSQMSDLSPETMNAAGRNEDVPSSGSRDVTSSPEALQNASRGSSDNGEGAQGAGSVDVPDDPTPENLFTREQASPCSPEYAHDGEDDRQGRARPEGSSGEDGRLTDEEEDDQAECNALKAQLLALVAAIDGRAQIRGSQAPHEKSGRMRGIRKALGHKWKSQLATVLQDIDRDQKNGDTTATPRGETG